jgi:Family of unknown function (DUF6158)
MDRIETLLDEVYVGEERVSRDEIYRRAVAAQLPGPLVTALEKLPEGEYAQDEVEEALGQVGPPEAEPGEGVPAERLPDDDLLRELGELHRTRVETLRHGSDQALARSTARTEELEAEYLRRFPDREIDPERLREGARQREAPATRPVEESTAAELAADDEAPLPGLGTVDGSRPPGMEFIEPV